MHRATAAIAVAALVVIAGCSAFGGAGTTREPFDVDGTATDSGTAADSPPVISFNPVQDTTPSPFLIVEAHETELDGRTYTVQFTHNETYENGTTVQANRYTTRYGTNRSTFHMDQRAYYRNDSVTRRLYANGTHVWAWENRDDDPGSSVRLLTGADGDPIPPYQFSVEDPQDAVLTGLITMDVTDVEKLDTVPSGVDTPVFRVTANETSNRHPYGDRTLNASLTLIVTENGRIIEYHHEYAYVEDGRTVHAETRVEYLAPDATTVDRPSWVPANASSSPSTATADNATTSSSGSAASNGTVGTGTTADAVARRAATPALAGSAVGSTAT